MQRLTEAYITAEGHPSRPLPSKVTSRPCHYLNEAGPDHYFTWMKKRPERKGNVSFSEKDSGENTKERKRESEKIKSKPFAFQVSQASKEDKEQSGLGSRVLSGN